MLSDVILYVHPLKNVNEKFEHAQVYWKVFYVKSVVLLKILKHHVVVFSIFSKNANADFSNEYSTEIFFDEYIAIVWQCIPSVSLHFINLKVQ